MRELAAIHWSGRVGAEGLPRPVCVRWLGLFRGRMPRTLADWAQLLEWELAPDRDRAAEPLWRGRSLLGRRAPGIGLGYHAEAVRVVRSADSWSEPADPRTGRLTLRQSLPRRAWRDWHAFARAQAWHWPTYHAEAWLGLDAVPTALVLGTWAPALREVAVELGRRFNLPVQEVPAVN